MTDLSDETLEDQCGFSKFVMFYYLITKSPDSHESVWRISQDPEIRLRTQAADNQKPSPFHWFIMFHISMGGGLEFCLRGAKPTKAPPRGEGTANNCCVFWSKQLTYVTNQPTSRVSCNFMEQTDALLWNRHLYWKSQWTNGSDETDNDVRNKSLQSASTSSGVCGFCKVH